MQLQGRNLSEGMRGEDVALLHSELAQLIEAGRLDAEIADEEAAGQRFGQTTYEAVIRFQEQHGLDPSGVVEDQTALRINQEVDALQPYVVTGRVFNRTRAGVDGLRVEIVDKNVGGDARLAETTTGDGGTYRAAFTTESLRERGKLRPDLQVRILAGETFLGASDVHYNASIRETLNVLLAEQAGPALASEHETLTGGLAAHYQGSLRDLQETDERRDVTYLANKTGWDARAVAMAALADRLSAADGRQGAIEPAFFYALLRAGLPADENALYQIGPETAAAVWRQGIQQGVIPAALERRIPEVTEQFQRLSVRRVLDGPALAGVSPLGEMLALSLGDDAGRQQQFADLYIQYRGDPTRLWEAVREAFGEEAEQRLRVDGQLGYLTLNNAPLIGRLHAAAGDAGLRGPLDLVEVGYYRAGVWQEAIGSDPVPPEIPGQDDAERRSRYADLMAAQVRLSFPTAVVAQMVKSGETPLANGLQEQVHAFLSEHHETFQIGLQPVAQYIAHSDLQVEPEVVKEIARIQRVYQITPGDDAMNALLERDVDSAYAVVRYGRERFARAFGDVVGGQDKARLIHAKAQQVHNTIVNVALSYLTSRVAPAVGVHSPAKFIDPAPHASDVIAYATLESLFGEMDYCTCEHCRSVLSPAAYLVDLLLFLDREEQVWSADLASWGQDHGAPYPFVDQEAWTSYQDHWNALHPGEPLPDTQIPPLEVLLSRRPDLQHLPLTCENTNTPLPYIDLVNETLEFFVANNLTLKNVNGKDYEGHTTGSDATPEELLAGPQFGDTEAAIQAYNLLAEAPFPPPLPFHQPLENLRRTFDRFEAPLQQVMEALRQDDSLERSSADDYGWRDILMEEIGLSRAEYALLSERQAPNNSTDVLLTLKILYGFDPAASGQEVRETLSQAKTFARRVGVTYEELAEILTTRFINPNAALIPRLERLSVPFSTLKALKDGVLTPAAFLGELPPDVDEAQYGDDIPAWVTGEANYARIMSLVVLVAPDECDFDQVTIRYSDPDKLAQPVRDIEFIRLARFIRLWKKLGWSIEQTDKAIGALYPDDQTPNGADDAVSLEHLDASFLTLLPRLGTVKRVMQALKLKPTKDLLPLLACFAPIDTHGAASLYRSMFLSPALAGQAPAFADDGYGNFLADATQKLADHVETLRAAFSLTGEEMALITWDLGYDADTPLSLDTVSAVFRRGWLARKLKLSVSEFLLLAHYTDLDPFAAPDPPLPPIERLVDLLGRLRDASIKPVQALYLVWNHDVSGLSAPDEVAVSGFARTLRADLAAIAREFALVDDPDGRIAHDRMALVYGVEAAGQFFGLLDRIVVTDVPYNHAQATLEQAIQDATEGHIAYDHLRKRLAYTAGVMPDATRDALKAAAGVTAAFQDALDALHTKSRSFFTHYPKLQQYHDDYIASSDPIEAKRAALLASLLLELEPLRKQQHALQAISAVIQVDVDFARTLLGDTAVLQASGDVTQPALEDLAAIEEAGLWAEFFFADTAGGAPDLPAGSEASLAYGGSNPLPANGSNPANAISGLWSGYLEAPENGFYNFYVEADTGATVALTLGSTSVSLTQNDGLWSNDQPIELVGGALYSVTLQVEKVKDTLAVRWETAGRGREVIPARYLYPAARVGHLRTTYVRFLKAASLASAAGLTARETAYLASYPGYHIDNKGWLNSLPADGSPDTSTFSTLLAAFTALLDFAYLKAALAPEDERLPAVLEDPAAAEAGGLLYSLTRWEPGSLGALLGRFGMTLDDLGHVEDFRRVYDAYGWIRAMGFPASALLEAATNEPIAATVVGLQAALRARYDPSSWLDVIRPINDEMRSLQRDALVAYILHHMHAHPATAHIDTPEKLFEYFLMDVQMDPCMQTSRVRHALSSVQLFIERCLLNIEPRVAPSAIEAGYWSWMKRYRVWEANRKVYLWPENWLEPELRDDQSPFFKETMSELLQSDITDDRAAVALLGYLSKLEEVAKLEPCGIHYVEGKPGTSDDVAHVVARTAGGSRKYYYRRREHGSWTPWEPIGLDIEDNPVLPVVWKGRLLLFWLRILKQPIVNPPPVQPTDKKLQDVDASKIIQSDLPKVKIQAMLCWSEYFSGKWQPTKTSDIDNPASLRPSTVDSFRRSGLVILADKDQPYLRLLVCAFGANPGAAYFDLYNTHSLPEKGNWDQGYDYSDPRRFKLASYSEVVWQDPITNEKTIVVHNDLVIEYTGANAELSVIRSNFGLNATRMLQPRHGLKNIKETPFFYADSRHLFYVRTEARPVPVGKQGGYGIGSLSDLSVAQIPSLVLEESLYFPSKAEPDPLVSAAINGAAPIQYFLTEDAYIDKGIGVTGSVIYDNTVIGMQGGQFKEQSGS